MPSTYETSAVSFATSSPYQETMASDSRQELLHLFLTEKNYFLRIANSILRNLSDAEDAIQSSFCSAWQAVTNFRGESSMKTWFSRIVSNHSLIALKKLRRNKLLSIDDDSGCLQDFEQKYKSVVENPEQIAVRREALGLIRTHLGSLPPETRAVIVLYLSLGHSIHEIAEIRGKTRLSVTAHLHRGKALLRKSVHRRTLSFSSAQTEKTVLNEQAVPGAASLRFQHGRHSLTMAMRVDHGIERPAIRSDVPRLRRNVED